MQIRGKALKRKLPLPAGEGWGEGRGVANLLSPHLGPLPRWGEEEIFLSLFPVLLPSV